MDKFILTNTDMTAVELMDSNYINNKGAALYKPDTYFGAMEYYHLAAAMGNTKAISNLGYCYLYGRDTEKNTNLAIAYFKIAAKREDTDAAYKLGDIYGSDKWGVKDKELSVYYYRMAASFIIDDEWEKDGVAWCKELEEYPSLCFALGRELFIGGSMNTNIDLSYQFLKHAEKGYRIAVLNGDTMYNESYKNVLAMLDNTAFDEIRNEYAEEFEDDEEE